MGRRVLLTLLCVAAGVVTLAASTAIKVTAIVDKGRVLASFAAPGAFNRDAEVVMRSGLVLTFTFTLELRRPQAIWFDSTVGQLVVASTVKHDPLTGRYQVSKSHDGRVVWSEQTDQLPSVRAWMTSFDQVPLDPQRPLEANAEYYVRVRMQSNPRPTFSLWSIWPWGRSDGFGQADFAVIR
jgi:hypothetical protein